VNAAFTAPKFVCPLDTAFFTDSSTGPVTGWSWDFGNGITSNIQAPPYQFYTSGTGLKKYTVIQTVYAANGCSDTAMHEIVVPNNCYIAVPNAFTPNGDGLNDYLYPLNAYKAIDLDFKVYNRYGQLIWQTRDWTQKWDGRINGNPQGSGTYVWHLVYTDPGKGKKIDLKGNTVLIR
jgi:gliding motility-associated-like protein